MTEDISDRHGGVRVTGDNGADGPKAFYILIEARPGMEEDVEQMLRDIRTAVEDEPATGPWYAVRHYPTTFAIFEAFPDICRPRRACGGPRRQHLPRRRAHEPHPRPARARAEGRRAARQDRNCADDVDDRLSSLQMPRHGRPARCPRQARPDQSAFRNCRRGPRGGDPRD